MHHEPSGMLEMSQGNRREIDEQKLHGQINTHFYEATKIEPTGHASLAGIVFRRELKTMYFRSLRKLGRLVRAINFPVFVGDRRRPEPRDPMFLGCPSNAVNVASAGAAKLLLKSTFGKAGNYIIFRRKTALDVVIISQEHR
jgi:hypothetical protein